MGLKGHLEWHPKGTTLAQAVKSTAQGYRRKFGQYPDAIYTRSAEGDTVVRVKKGVLVRVLPLATVPPEHYFAVAQRGS